MTYYRSEKSREACGHFDLRNVIEMAPVPEEVAPDAISLLIAEKSADKVRKRLVCSFVPDPPSKKMWLAAWCSAVSLVWLGAGTLPRWWQWSRYRALAHASILW